ncbi:hypothetical protein GCM10027089_19520 [Nocardia thraciensis]
MVEGKPSLAGPRFAQGETRSAHSKSGFDIGRCTYYLPMTARYSSDKLSSGSYQRRVCDSNAMADGAVRTECSGTIYPRKVTGNTACGRAAKTLDIRLTALAAECGYRRECQ